MLELLASADFENPRPSAEPDCHICRGDARRFDPAFRDAEFVRLPPVIRQNKFGPLEVPYSVLQR